MWLANFRRVITFMTYGPSLKVLIVFQFHVYNVEEIKRKAKGGIIYRNSIYHIVQQNFKLIRKSLSN